MDRVFVVAVAAALFFFSEVRADVPAKAAEPGKAKGAEQATTMPDQPGTPSPQLIAALGKHESRGNDFAVGDKHLPPGKWAYGYLQIRQPCLDDVNRRHGTNHKPEDCLGNRKLSVWVCQRYLEIYATEKRLGRKPTDEDKARIWNGGPNGWKRTATEGYWPLVRQYLPQQ